MKFRTIRIAIPTLNCALTGPIGMFLWDAVRLSMTPGSEWRFSLNIVNDKHPTEYARNVLCHDFLKSGEDAIWFVDSDTLPSANSFELLKVDADIVAGVYPIYRRERKDMIPLDWSFYRRTGDHQYHYKVLEDYEGKVTTADAAGTGCMIIRRNVIEHFAKDVPRDRDGIPAIFQWPRECTGRDITSDDFDFCDRTKEAGFTLKVHTGVRWGHLKTKDLADTYQQLKQAFLFGVTEASQPTSSSAA